MEYYSVVKNNNIMKFAGKWLELENIILSEVTQTQKDKHGIIHSCEDIRCKAKDNQATIHSPREAGEKERP